MGAAWACEQVRVLISLGCEVTAALPSADAGLGPSYRRAGAAVVEADLDFPRQEPWKLPRKLAECRSLIREVQPDLIHTHHLGTTLVVRLAFRRNPPVPCIFQVPGPLHLESPFFAQVETRLAGRQDYWIATCEWTRRKYLEIGIAPERVFLSYAGTDIRRFADGRRGKLRDELGIGPDIPLIGLIAYMYAPKWILGQERGLKGHEDFIAAFNLARAKDPSLKGVIIGGAWGNAKWYEDRLRYLGHKLCDGSLVFLGTRSDVPALLPDLDLVVVPSRSENCGGALEPLLSGIPVIATSVGGLPELIRDRETGWLVPPREPAALAGAILEALESRSEMRRRAVAGQRLATRLFDVGRTAREIAAAYHKLLEMRPVPTGRRAKYDRGRNGGPEVSVKNV
jgi:glycosyltransferase involved in cell wall biosynthesis